MLPRPTIEAFDAWLAARSLRLDAIVVGGSALALLGVTDRQTRDFDILHPELPEEIAAAAREFAAHLRSEGVELADDWLNNGPMQLADVLPDGWRLRVQVAFTGASLTLTTLGRADLLATKLYEAEPWLAEQDANPMWHDHVHATLEDLRRRLGHGL